MANEDGEDPSCLVYQWLQVAAMLGSDEAAEMADGVYEGALSPGGDETVAVLHYQVAEWFIRGQNGVEPNVEHGISQLERAQQFQLQQSVDLGDGLASLRNALPEEQRARFDGIFPVVG
jgi:hypothetical protein